MPTRVLKHRKNKGMAYTLEAATPECLTPKEALARERTQLGLDQPIWKQFITWIVGIPRLDFGTSMWTGRPITTSYCSLREGAIPRSSSKRFAGWPRASAPNR